MAQFSRSFITHPLLLLLLLLLLHLVPVLLNVILPSSDGLSFHQHMFVGLFISLSAFCFFVGRIMHKLLNGSASRAGSGTVRLDPLCFLAKCCKR